MTRGSAPSDPIAANDEALFERVAAILDSARSRAVRSVNSAMVHAYWLIGAELVEVDQRGAARARYGERLLERLAERLTTSFGRGMGIATLRRIRAFYLAYPAGSMLAGDSGDAAMRSTPLITSADTEAESGGDARPAPVTAIGAAELQKRSTALIESARQGIGVFPPGLGWSHYLVLLRVADPGTRAFYEREAAREAWSVRELERQIASLLYERLAKSRDAAGVLALARVGQTVATPADVIKDPFVLEFLDLEERPRWLERDLEQAIIDRLEAFLLELGKGFCFVARQKRITLDGDHFYVDLVFYNRLLSCFVLVDLKVGKLNHQDLGQMRMYVNWFDRHQRAEHEAPTVGIVLCSEKNDAMVKITLPETEKQLHTSRYQLYLPTEEELRDELTRERDAAEQAFRASGTSDEKDPSAGH